MTLRLKANHLRIRVARPDLDAFCRHGRAESTTAFGAGAALTCVLMAEAEASQPTASFDGATVTVRVPQALAEEWATTDRVGFEADQPTDAGETLHLLVEKDIGCQHQDDPEHDAKFTELTDATP